MTLAYTHPLSLSVTHPLASVQNSFTETVVKSVLVWRIDTKSTIETAGVASLWMDEMLSGWICLRPQLVNSIKLWG